MRAEELRQSPLGGDVGPRQRRLDARRLLETDGGTNVPFLRYHVWMMLCVYEFKPRGSWRRTPPFLMEIHEPQVLRVLHLLGGLGQYQFTPHSQMPTAEHPRTDKTLLGVRGAVF